MNFLIIGGFLGSGKTSLLLQLTKYMAGQGIGKTVILENEVGKIGIDDRMLSGAGYEVRGLFSGCVCCTMAGELSLTVKAIEQEMAPDWIIMEATGMAFPHNVKEHLRDSLGMDSRICCLVDAKRWPRLVNALEQLLPQQLKDADTVLINKTDLVDEAQLNSVRDSVLSFSDHPEIFPVCLNGEVGREVFEAILGKKKQA